MPTPQIANIQVPQVPTMAPVQGAEPIANGGDIAQMMSPMIRAANQPLPDPYKQGVDIAQPHMNQVPQAAQYDDHRSPITGNQGDIRNARRQNATAGLANMIGQFGQRIQEKKQANLRDKLVDVMKYKQNSENATTVLNDPNASPQAKQMAQRVFEANKKQLNDILSDPKHQKEMAKALDISFVDPSKNKTPEVQAYQQAMQQFKAAGPFNSDNPQEHAVAQVANNADSAAAKSPMSPQLPQYAAPAQPNVSPRSATPYADAALAKDSPTVEANPQYNAVLQQKEAAQKQLTTMIPHFIDTASKQLIQQAKDGNAAAREVFKASSDYRTHSLDAITKLDIANEKDATTLKTTAMRNSAIIASASMRAAAAIKVAETNGLSREQAATIKSTGAADIDKHINSTEQVLKTYGQREADIKNSSMSTSEQAQALKALEVQKDMDNKKLSALQVLRARDFPDVPMPKETPPPPEKNMFEKLYNYLEENYGDKKGTESNANSQPAGSSKPADQKPRINLLGNDESDESSDDSEDNSDSY